MRSASSAWSRGELAQDAGRTPPASTSVAPCGDLRARSGTGDAAARRAARRPAAANGTASRNGASSPRRHVEAGERVPLLALGDAHLRCLKSSICSGAHQPGVVVLVAGERQAVALDRVGDEAGRRVVRDAVERVEHRLEVVAAEVGHQRVQRGVVVLVEQRADPRVAAEVALQLRRARRRRP